MKINLLDEMALSGKDMGSLVDTISEITAATKDLEVAGKDITFLSLCEIPELQQAGKRTFYVLTEEYIEDFLNGKKLKVGTVAADFISDELYEQLKTTTGLIAIINSEKYLISDYAIPTLTIRASVGGALTISKQNLIRNLHLADAVFTKNEKIHFVYREDENGVKKIFAGLGGTFQSCPQTILCETIDALKSDKIVKDLAIHKWEICHELTEIYVDFPKLASEYNKTYKIKDIVPGLVLSTSDIGSSCITLKSTYRHKNSDNYFIMDEIMLKHTKGASKDILVQLADEKIFSAIHSFPESLSNLVGINLINYTKEDVTTDSGKAANDLAFDELMKDVIRKTFKNAISVVMCKKMLEYMKEQFIPSKQYTLYDIAMMFMIIPDFLLELNRVTLNDFRKACTEIPFYIYAYYKDNKLFEYAEEQEQDSAADVVEFTEKPKKRGRKKSAPRQVSQYEVLDGGLVIENIEQLSFGF